MAERIIYGLVDPRDGAIRYVGKSTRGRLRPKEHHKDRTRTKRGFWIRKLKRLGLKFEIVILEHEPENLNEAETWWIEAAREVAGKRVTNIANGGEGRGAGFRHSPESRAKLSAARKGQKHSHETRAKMSATRKGLPKSIEHRAKMSASHQGKKRGPQTPEHRAKIGAAQLGNKRGPLSLETRARISIAVKMAIRERRTSSLSSALA